MTWLLWSPGWRNGTGRAITCCGSGGFTESSIRIAPSLPAATGSRPLLRKEKSPPPEMTDAYRELGWEYVCTLAGTFHIWRCGDPAVPGAGHGTPVVQSMGYGYLERKMRRHLLRLPAILLVCLGICVLPWFWGAGDMPLVDQLEHALPGEGLFWLLMAAAAVGFELLDAFRMRRLLRSLGTGVPLERPRSWRLQKRVTQAVMVLIWAGVLISWLLPDGGDPHFTRSAMDGDGEPLAEVVYVDLRELEGSEELTGFSAERKSLLLAPRMYWTRQSTEGPGGPLNLISGNTLVLPHGDGRAGLRWRKSSRPGRSGSAAGAGTAKGPRTGQLLVGRR